MLAFQACGGPRTWALTLLLIHAGVVLGTAFQHHDAACHQQSRFHCTSCSFVAAASGVAQDATARHPILPLAERLSAEALPLPQTTSVLGLCGRSPPI